MPTPRDFSTMDDTDIAFAMSDGDKESKAYNICIRLLKEINIEGIHTTGILYMNIMFHNLKMTGTKIEDLYIACGSDLSIMKAFLQVYGESLSHTTDLTILIEELHEVNEELDVRPFLPEIEILLPELNSPIAVAEKHYINMILLRIRNFFERINPMKST
jgi:hypothetical protein